VLLFTSYYWDGPFKEGEMGEACSLGGRKDVHIKFW
jgi:hypothetical protein